MTTYDASNSEIFVYSFKDGLLSKIAHDLKIQASSFSIEMDTEANTLNASVDALSLKVLCCMKRGVPAPNTLSASDKKKIEVNLLKNVLNTKRFPKISFVSSSIQPESDGFSIQGELSLHGRTRSVRVRATRQGHLLVAELTLHQPDYGIKPFKAMMGTLKVKPDVKVVISIPADL